MYTHKRWIYWPYVCRPITTNMIEEEEEERGKKNGLLVVISALYSSIETF